ncbi:MULTISPECIES: hypothetical protein [Vibrio]|uniref:WD40 repeat protein n=1 Tax=Vibrio echinoideorum TaxID=2100116 RepID=A0ABU9FNT2_9VIBR|nr:MULTISPECIES: hypothetical protein [Vibrio]MCF7506871.1 hypothetical protein [Vibrio sp. L3-7]OED73283.1 hypothetical protein A143_03395 [Vibrio splendidus ZS-139]TVU67547.1 hypothetical protein FQP87_24040 [Vibrio tasmaniensis]
MKWILLFLSCVSFVAFGSEVASSAQQSKSDSNLSHFDLPLLLGDWYLMNPEPEQETENFRAIKLTLDSNYSFTIDIQKKDYSVDHWEGLYNANEDTLILGLNTSEPQIYAYSSNHNMLNLNGVLFTKALPNALAGIWSSAELSGSDLSASNIQKMDLVLQPDFVFMFRVSDEVGSEVVRRGVYYTEGDQLVLLYENGEHGTRYTLNSDVLTLQGEEGDMFAVLNRIR